MARTKEEKMEADRIHSREYRLRNREKILPKLRKYYQSARGKAWHKQYAEKKKGIDRISFIKHKDKHRVRYNTRWRYGKLPKGYQYHHTTFPYHVDYWIGIYYTEHYKLRNLKLTPLEVVEE